MPEGITEGLGLHVILNAGEPNTNPNLGMLLRNIHNLPNLMVMSI